MKLGYLIVYVPDVAAALDFYRRAFGLTARFEHPSGDYAELDTGETALAFANHSIGRDNLPGGYTSLQALPRPAGFEIALVTSDVPTAVDRAVAAGASVVAAPVDKPWGQTVAYVRAPDGSLLELCTPIAPPAE